LLRCRDCRVVETKGGISADLLVPDDIGSGAALEGVAVRFPMVGDLPDAGLHDSHIAHRTGRSHNDFEIHPTDQLSGGSPWRVARLNAPDERGSRDIAPGLIDDIRLSVKDGMSRQDRQSQS